MYAVSFLKINFVMYFISAKHSLEFCFCNLVILEQETAAFTVGKKETANKGTDLAVTTVRENKRWLFYTKVRRCSYVQHR